MRALNFRPVVSCGKALLPLPGNMVGLASFPLHRGLTFRAVAFHPDRPWVAICQLTPGADESGHEPGTTAITLGAERLRLIAAQMIEIADHLDIKPAKETRK